MIGSHLTRDFLWLAPILMIPGSHRHNYYWELKLISATRNKHVSSHKIKKPHQKVLDVMWCWDGHNYGRLSVHVQDLGGELEGRRGRGLASLANVLL